MKVKCEWEEDEVETDEGYEMEGIVVTCGRCGHQTESCGTSESSARRCLALLREECPRKENNFYVIPGLPVLSERYFGSVKQKPGIEEDKGW